MLTETQTSQQLSQPLKVEKTQVASTVGSSGEEAIEVDLHPAADANVARPLVIERVHSKSLQVKEDGDFLRILEGFNKAGEKCKRCRIQKGTDEVWRCLGAKYPNSSPLPADPKSMSLEARKKFLEKLLSRLLELHPRRAPL